MAERIISADSHFEIPFERVLEHLPEKHREAAVAMRTGLMEKMWDPLESTCRHASLSIL